MKKKFLIFASTFLLGCSFPLFGKGNTISFQEKFDQAKEGDYIATVQQGHCSLLFIRSLSPEILILEEVSIPEEMIDLKKIHWQEWLDKKAPGHTSWTLYEIDRKSGTLLESFSCSKKGWLFLSESEQFFSKLLSLPLEEVPREERKKIGAAPPSQEEDRRALWNPPVTVDGKKLSKPTFEVLKAQWPSDGSLLSRCQIELYFLKNSSPFPYWIEIKSTHYAFKIRSIDSGKNLTSPITGPMPHRLPRFNGPVQKGPEQWKLSIETPLYYKQLRLFALDVTEGENSKKAIPIPFTITPTTDKERLILEIKTADLAQKLTPTHRYEWVLIPEGSTDIYITSEEVFLSP